MGLSEIITQRNWDRRILDLRFSATVAFVDQPIPPYDPKKELY